MTRQDPTAIDPRRLDALRADVVAARWARRCHDRDRDRLVAALRALDHYLAWATRLDNLHRHEDAVRGGGPARRPAPGSLLAERLDVCAELARLTA